VEGQIGVKLFVVCGPTAVGKGTIIARLLAQFPQIYVSVSATTRAPREGEIDGTHYFFVSDARFDQLIATDGLLEWATIHNSDRYGTPRAAVEQALNEGRPVILEIDYQGARQVRASMPDSLQVFIAPPSWEELVRRLVSRGTETPEQIERRLASARIELACQNEFDRVIVNDDLDKAVADLVEFMGLSHDAESKS
jgi:guanylate kinase